MIKVYTGTMKSGKSAKLIADIKLAKQNNINILVLSSKAGFRENKIISSRDGGKAEAIGISSIRDIITLIESQENKVHKVFVDEVQFLPDDLEGIIEVINYSVLNNIKIIISGLDLNCFGKPFPIMSNLLCYADEIVKFKGYCDKCTDEESNRVVRYKGQDIDRDEENVLVVDTKSKLKYYSMCSSCFIKEFY